MKTSVIVTLYNGEMFIEELLDSIKNQTSFIDEVIIADDLSTDNSFEIVLNYIKINKLENNWKLYKNSSNLGFKLNFLNSAKRAVGDIIYFCDQDDVWVNDKIKDMNNQFERSQNIYALICNEDRIDQYGKTLKNKVVINDNSIESINFYSEIRNCFGAGHLLAVRKVFFDKYVDFIIAQNLTFDIPFCLIAALFGKLQRLNKVLVHRRIHNNNTSGISSNKFSAISSSERIRKGRETRLSYYKSIKILMKENDINDITFFDFIDIQEKSIQAIDAKKILPLLKELISINNCINRKLTLAGIYSIICKK